MSNTIRRGSAATCGHAATGSSNVFINGRGASRVGVDTCAGVILGPGVQTVLVNGYPISIAGDAVAPHGQNEHAGPVTANPSPNVSAGTG